jgi:tetratricopeptide (TPR) repeat protein
MYRSMRMLMQGRYGEARELTQSFLRVGQEIGDINVLQTYAMQVAFILVGEGEIETAIGAADAGAERFHRVLTWRAGVAWGHALVGDLERARELFEPLAAREFSAFPKDMLWTMSMAFLAEACARIGDRPRAGMLYDMLRPYTDSYISVGYGVHYMGAVARYVGQLAATLGRRDEARALFEKAVEMERRVEATPWCALAELELARLLAAQGERTRAREVAESGLKRARRAGMKRVTADLEAIRTRAGGRATKVEPQPDEGPAKSMSPGTPRRSQTTR